jgi:hypothetical protein
MNKSVSIFILYTVTLTVVGFLVYFTLNRPEKIKKPQVMNELPQPQKFETHWWGYGWRPWWRRYGGVPGLEPDNSKIPKPLKPIIIPIKSLH